MNMYVVKVHPHRAITEPDYFIKEIEKCEAKRDEEIARVEAGFDVDEPTKVENESKETEWERIQKMPDAEYLMRTVLPVLYQGMSIVDLERPSAPLEFLALHLLKNQDQVSLPPRTYS